MKAYSAFIRLTCLIQGKHILVCTAPLIMTPFFYYRCVKLASVDKITILLNQLELKTRYDCNWHYFMCRIYLTVTLPNTEKEWDSTTCIMLLLPYRLLWRHTLLRLPMNGIWGRRLKGRSTHTTTHTDTEAISRLGLFFITVLKMFILLQLTSLHLLHQILFHTMEVLCNNPR